MRFVCAWCNEDITDDDSPHNAALCIGPSLNRWREEPQQTGENGNG